MRASVPSPAKGRILVVQDQSPMRSALAAALRAEGYVVRCEADGRAIGTVVTEFTPDLAILEVNLRRGPDG